MLTKSIGAAIFVAAVTVGVPTAGYTWNLVCGVSIALEKTNEMAKWEADAHALRGISFFYLGISELQRLDLKKDGTFDEPDSISTKGVSATQSALKTLKDSAAEFAEAAKYAKQYNLGDKKGLDLLASLEKGVLSLAKAMETGKHLPTLKEVQDVARDSNEFVVHGLDLSQKHLGMAMPGHGEGGERYKLKN